MLRPLHDRIFSVLRRIRQDGTFNQTLPVERLIQMKTLKRVWSFDLSAATDRLPLELQVWVLSSLLVNTNPFTATLKGHSAVGLANQLTGEPAARA